MADSGEIVDGVVCNLMRPKSPMASSSAARLAQRLLQIAFHAAWGLGVGWRTMRRCGVTAGDDPSVSRVIRRIPSIAFGATGWPGGEGAAFGRPRPAYAGAVYTGLSR